MIYIFLGITVLFFVLLGIKGLLPKELKKEFCTICAAISLTWITLLVLFWLGRSDNQVLVALLMGQSVVGLFYLAEKKVAEKHKVFRLPFLLTLTLVAYALVGGVRGIIGPVVLVLILWVVFGFLYVYRTDKKMKGFVDKVIACCKNW